MSYKSDIEIAREAKVLPITQVAEKLGIEADDLDFENRPEDFALITDKIDAELFGLFPEIK